MRLKSQLQHESDARRILHHAGNPRTSTNLLAFYNDERLPVAFFKPQAGVYCGALQAVYAMAWC